MPHNPSAAFTTVIGTTLSNLSIERPASGPSHQIFPSGGETAADTPAEEIAASLLRKDRGTFNEFH